MSRAVNLMYNEIDKLLFELSMTRCNELVQKTALEILERKKQKQSNIQRNWFTNNFYRGNIPVDEPYRIILEDLRDRLLSTRSYIIKLLDHDIVIGTDIDESESSPILSSNELIEPLMMIYQSLIENGSEIIAQGNLKKVIRRMVCFGVSMVKLDIRQESTKHSKAMDCVTEYLSLGTYSTWSEDEKINFLVKELTGKRPLIPWNYFSSNNQNIPADVRDVLDTFKMIARLSPESFGAYVISMARSASDILLVELLQKEVFFLIN